MITQIREIDSLINLQMALFSNENKEPVKIIKFGGRTLIEDLKEIVENEFSVEALISNKTENSSRRQALCFAIKTRFPHVRFKELAIMFRKNHSTLVYSNQKFQRDLDVSDKLAVDSLSYFDNLINGL